MGKRFKTSSVLLIVASLTASCSLKKPPERPESSSNQVKPTNFEVKFEQYTLANGLKVILHQDKSDPIVAIATIVHVGSNREKPGKTGFAHFFEHMSFNDSENVPKGANRKMIAELGGYRNGATWSDGTIYYEVVPKDAFEKLLWIDSDRFGYMIKTVDQGTLEREKQVVKNEKRQRIDNRPYGHTSNVVKKALYPKDHPYSWSVIGTLADLQAASIDDVSEFYKQYYVPSNATLVIAGDIDFKDTKKKVERWFGEIPASVPVEKMKPRPAKLKRDIKLFHEDNFAKLPELTLTFPSIQQYHPDSYALNILGYLLSEGKNAALYKILVEKQKLAPSPYAFNHSTELAGAFTISVKANQGVKLDKVNTAINRALLDFEQNSFSDDQLNSIKAQLETNFYYKIESVLNKALQLGIYNEYAGSGDFVTRDIQNITRVSRADIMRVYHQYIKDKPAVITSFVPKGQKELVLTGSTKADVSEELVKQGTEKKFIENAPLKYQKTVTKHDRSEPPLSELAEFKTPEIWKATTQNGIQVFGINKSELPVVNFSLRINGGQSLDQKDKIGTAVLLAQSMNEGTSHKTPQQLEEAIGLLGASLTVHANVESLTISGRCLSKNFKQTMALMKEILLAPRFDKKEFTRLKSTRLTRIQQSKGNASQIANRVFSKLLYGESHVLGQPKGGSISSVKNINIDDLTAFYKNNVSPKNASFHFVGAISQNQALEALELFKDWQGNPVIMPKQPPTSPRTQPAIYFVDLPNSKQSVLYVGKELGSDFHDSIYPISFANNQLGQGMSARLSQTLRIQKGYTYGAFSYVSPSIFQSTFAAKTQVRSNVTLESLLILKDLIGNYQATYFEKDLTTSKNMTIKSDSLRFETHKQLIKMLETMSLYQKPIDYIGKRQNYVSQLKLEEVHQTIKQYLNEQEMLYLVVGDAKTQLSKMASLGYGKPILIDIDGDPI